MRTDQAPVVIAESHEVYLRDDGSTYTRKEIFVKLDITFRDRMLKILKGPPLSVFLCISLHCDESMTAFPSITTIENETGYSRPAVLAALDFLIQAGLVERRHRQKESGEADSNLYAIRGFCTMGSKPDLLGVANDVSYPQLTSLATVANDVNPKKIPYKKNPIEEESAAPDGAGADAPTREPKPKKSSPPQEKAGDIPAAVTYRRLVHQWPPRVVWENLKTVSNLALWEEIITAWVSMGWKPGNLAGMLEFYQRGEIPGARRQAAPSPPPLPEDNGDWVETARRYQEARGYDAIT